MYFGTIQYSAKCQSTTSYYILFYLFPLNLPYATCITMKNPVNLASKDYFLWKIRYISTQEPVHNETR